MKKYPSIEFVGGRIFNRMNILRVLSGEKVSETIPISPQVFKQCSDFRKDVYDQLMRIPRGCTKSYSEVAKSMGRPRAYRAVAQACRANILPVIIPCHRVVGSDGSLTGYSGGGTEMKQRLLDMERAKL
ncbi:6-O-methylguanine DNA methyltransferase, DNA binding domain protein [Oesophagostomum dentatum]|uniref:Methylated-DNA--protein-cysteine methyltransferase n=1 Tax=Oesophagostomum dentatum TaxID=61180 RepID=A0A0B1SPL4_OESDE|nr:6-O-methylguanine DNA methyltransferase, DNA binding domain protein [Oesophagostomum dentatum]